MTLYSRVAETEAAKVGRFSPVVPVRLRVKIAHECVPPASFVRVDSASSDQPAGVVHAELVLFAFARITAKSPDAVSAGRLIGIDVLEAFLPFVKPRYLTAATRAYRATIA